MQKKLTTRCSNCHFLAPFLEPSSLLSASPFSFTLHLQSAFIALRTRFIELVLFFFLYLHFSSQTFQFSGSCFLLFLCFPVGVLALLLLRILEGPLLFFSTVYYFFFYFTTVWSKSGSLINVIILVIFNKNFR